MNFLKGHLQCYRAIRLLLISLCSFFLVISWIPIAHSQIPALPTNTSNDSQPPPDGVTRWGEIEVAAVKSPVDGKKLFEVASRTIFNRDNPPEGKIPVEIRAQEINERLERSISRAIAAQENPIILIATLNNRPVLWMKDDQKSRALKLVTVTEPDADYHGKSLDELAQEWQEVLQVEVTRLKQLFSPQVLRQRLVEAGQILLGLLVASGIFLLLQKFLTARQIALENRYQQELETAKQEAASSAQSEIGDGETAKIDRIVDWRSRFLAAMKQQLSVKRRLEFDTFLKWVLFWVLIFIWYIGIFAIAARVPFLMRWSHQVLETPLLLVLSWFAISFAVRISKTSIDYFTTTLEIHPYISLGEAQRIALRTRTIANSLKGLVTFVLIGVGIVWTLSIFGIPTNSILAGGALIGLAVSFGSQSLIKDLVNGCLILMEDQFAVGDVIEIGENSGLVENLNLRIVQIRNSEGKLITIPNSNISEVRNLTRLWSRVDFSIEVAYENDPKQVLAILDQVAQQMYREPEWRDRIPTPPEVLGIDAISHSGMLMRVWIQTAPMQQWSVGREYHLRVRQAFESNGIEIGRPQRISYNTSLVNQNSQN